MKNGRTFGTKATSVFILVFLLSAESALAGKKKGPVVDTVFLTGSMPVLDTVTGYPWHQTQGGVTIKLVPVPFESHVLYHTSLKEKSKGLFEDLLEDKNNPSTKYSITEEPIAYRFKPESLSFQLHITNQMNHVLRFGGSVLSFTADGKSLPVNTVSQEEFLKALILPQSSIDLTIVGPQVNSAMPSGAEIMSLKFLREMNDTAKSFLVSAKTITFAIYDVPIEVDAANNPTKKATFEWIFANNPKSVNGGFVETTTEQKLMPRDYMEIRKSPWKIK